MEIKMKLLMILTALLAVFISFPDDVDAKGNASAWHSSKDVRKVLEKPSSKAGGKFADAEAWTNDQALESSQDGMREECIDCKKPYRDRKKLEERCRTAR